MTTRSGEVQDVDYVSLKFRTQHVLDLEAAPEGDEGPGWRRASPQATALANRLRKNLEKLGGWAEREGIRIPLGIRRPPEGIAERSEYDLPEDGVLLTTVGRIVGRKAIHHLLKVVDNLRDLPVHAAEVE